MVNHPRLREISTEHPADITKMLANLVRDGLLRTDGAGRGMVYYLPWQEHYSDAFADRASADAKLFQPGGITPEQKTLTPELPPITPELSPKTPELPAITPVLPGAAQNQQAEPVVITDLTQITPEELALLHELAAPVAVRGRATPELVQETVLRLCNGRYLGLRVLAELLGRNADGVDLRKRILNPLVISKALQRAYPNPNDPRQAYTTRSHTSSGNTEQ